MRVLGVVVGVLLVAIGVYAGYQSLRAEAFSAAYRQRLQELSADYSRLSARYDSVVKRTSVTELVVEAGKLSVVISTLDGELKRIPTPLDPSGEIHVDYVVREGRLWIRRVHDSATAANDALVIDPALAGLSWEGTGADYGLAIYRPLSEGRWVISVTANGALSLVKKERGGPPLGVLEAAPKVQQFEQLEGEVQRDVAELGLIELAAAFWRTLMS